MPGPGVRRKGRPRPGLSCADSGPTESRNELYSIGSAGIFSSREMPAEWASRYSVQPPSMTIAWPVTKVLSGAAR